MPAHTYTQRFLVVLAMLCGALLPTGTVHATPERISLLYGEWQPQELIGVGDARVTAVGQVWRGTVDTTLFSATSAPTPIAALIEPGSRFTVTCSEPTTVVGVQFLGDSNDGWASIRVEAADESRDVSTRGDALVNDAYVEISNLPLRQHVIHVETLLAPSIAAFGHVTVVAFGCGAVAATGDASAGTRLFSADDQSAPAQTIYLPTIMS
ncbi:MAG: hypothetical protein KDE31_01270 [Caldilineaceae bacterium]|nr:hypothetical protein [Caldilineaceae bacterium]